MAKITSKGQVTIPKKIREFLGTDVVRFRVVKGKVVLEPVRDVRGIFKKYVKTSGLIRGFLPQEGKPVGGPFLLVAKKRRSILICDLRADIR